MRAVRSSPVPPGGGFTGSNSVYSLGGTGIPFINISTGSMGNNGALTGVTALPQTYNAPGAWVAFPAGAIAAGIPAAAAWYWVVFSSTTAGTVFNSVYTSGQPTAGTQTAFSTTGPGAFTGLTAEMSGPSYTLPANAMGPNGLVRSYTVWEFNNTANAKTVKTNFGATAFMSMSLPSLTRFFDLRNISNRGAANSQVGASGPGVTSVFSADTTVVQVASIDTTSPVTIAYTTTKATATDNMILSAHNIEVVWRA